MTTQLRVEGMTCNGCEQNVVEALEDVDGVTSASADRTADAATVEGSADVDALLSAVEDAGYSGST